VSVPHEGTQRVAVRFPVFRSLFNYGPKAPRKRYRIETAVDIRAGIHDSLNDIDLSQFANHLPLAATAPGDTDIDIEHLLEFRHPTARVALRRLGFIGVVGAKVGGLGGDEAIERVRCEHAVIRVQASSGSPHNGGQAADELVRLEQ
jgi:hypothetical protein